jgi:hypothetical protein
VSKKEEHSGNFSDPASRFPMAFLRQPVEINAPRWAAVQPWMAALLAARPALPAGEFPLAEAEQEGVLPWLAWRLHEAGLLGAIGEAEGAARAVLNRCAAWLMFGEQEIERLLDVADRAGVELVAIKGHAVGRTLYPGAPCRPTGDFDFLVAPGQAQAARDMMAREGYRQYHWYIGHYWLASLSFHCIEDGLSKHAMDLHWDITNRMYFRERIDLAAVVHRALEVPCGSRTIRVTDLIDSTIIACVHLAAFPPGTPVQMRWLLDVRLLLEALSADEIALLIERAAGWAAVEACLVFGEAAARLDDAPALQPALEALRAATSEKRMAEYDRTIRSRGFDLWSYWRRLPLKGKAMLPIEAARRMVRR